MDNIRHIGSSKPQKSLAVKEMAAQYRVSLQAVGGSRQFFLVDTFGRHVSKGARKWYGDKLIVAMSSAMLAMAGYISFRFIEAGFTSASMFSIPFLLIGAFLHIRNVRTWAKLEKRKWDTRWDLALYFEPEALWVKDYPIQGEKGELITAIIASRKYLSLLESATTMPIGVPHRDAYYSHMIETIMESKEDDISPYLYDEINYLCDSTKEYLSIYESLVSLDIDLRVRDLKK